MLQISFSQTVSQLPYSAPIRVAVFFPFDIRFVSWLVKPLIASQLRWAAVRRGWAGWVRVSLSEALAGPNPFFSSPRSHRRWLMTWGGLLYVPRTRSSSLSSRRLSRFVCLLIQAELQLLERTERRKNKSSQLFDAVKIGTLHGSTDRQADRQTQLNQDQTGFHDKLKWEGNWASCYERLICLIFIYSLVNDIFQSYHNVSLD